MPLNEMMISLEYHEDDSEETMDYEDRLFPYPDRFALKQYSYLNASLCVFENNRKCRETTASSPQASTVAPYGLYSKKIL